MSDVVKSKPFLTKWLPLVSVWALGIGAVVFARYRARWDAYVAIHRWVAELGVPDSIRQFDSLLIYVAATGIGAMVACKALGGSATGRIGLRRGPTGWMRMVSIALLPMVGGGMVLGLTRGSWNVGWESIGPRVMSGVVRAPMAEEFLFRGLLVGVIASVIGWRGSRFWMNAVATAALFASVHIEWKFGAIQRGWPTLLVTGVGGLWYAWLLSRWQSLWIPMVLHAGMNLGWLLAGTGGGAGGGGWTENLLRVGTIAIATILTTRMTRPMRSGEIPPPLIHATTS